MNCAFTSLGGLLFNCPSWNFYMLYYNSRVFLRYNNSSKIPCTKPWFFLQSFANFATLIVIFENVSAKGFFWLNIKNFEISVLTAHSRYLQTAALKHDSLLCLICAVMIMSASRKDFVRRENLIGQWPRRKTVLDRKLVHRRKILVWYESSYGRVCRHKFIRLFTVKTDGKIRREISLVVI